MSISYPTGYVEARVYSCLDHTQYWYPNNYVNMKTQSSSGTGGNYVNTYRRKIRESFLQANGIQAASFVGSQKAADVLNNLASGGLNFAYYTRTLFDLSSLSTTELVIPITKGNQKILLNTPESASTAGTSPSRSSVNYLIAGTDLSAQQRNSSIDISSTNPAL